MISKSQFHLFRDSVKITKFPSRRKIKTKEPLQRYVKTMSQRKSLFSPQWWPLFSDICLPPILPLSTPLPSLSPSFFSSTWAFSPYLAQTASRRSQPPDLKTGPDDASERLPAQFCQLTFPGHRPRKTPRPSNHRIYIFKLA